MTVSGAHAMTMWLTAVVWVLTASSVFAATDTNGHALRMSDTVMERTDDDESLLISALTDIGRSEIDRALSSLEALVSKRPNFRLAQLIYADLLLAKAQPIKAFGNHGGAPLEKIAELRDEARVRLRHHLSHARPNLVPESLLQLSSAQKRAVVVDVAESRLYLFENRSGEPYLLKDYYVSTGKNGAKKDREGDRKTPLGVYFVSGYIPPKDLPDLYGAGALPVTYPNEWDTRLGRTGYGIWIHGVPSDTYSRPPRASDGCVALANGDLKAIMGDLKPPHTPVILASGIRWLARREIEAERLRFLRQFERWRRDWESLDAERYARNYSRAFRNGSKTFSTWLGHKRRVNARKDYIRVGVSDLSVFLYPGEPDTVVVTFHQDYRSSNYNQRLWKRQYWRKDAEGVWRIVYEGVI